MSVRLTSPALVSLAVAILAGSGVRVRAAELQPRTLEAFNRYVRLTEARMDREIEGKAPFLFVDRLQPANREATLAKLNRGEIVIERLRTREANREIDVAGGLIHHWIGTTFVPRATVDRSVSLMQQYDRYQDMYAPNVQRSSTISRDGDHFKVYLRLFMKKVITVVLNTDNDVTYMRLDKSRAHVRSYTTRIAEVQDAGTKEEREAPVGKDGGYLWRFNNYCSLEERSSGTYIQCESLSLTRSIPVGLGWIVGPFVSSIPRESLEFTLGRLRTNLSGRSAGL
jgi:hypothetical protein